MKNILIIYSWTVYPPQANVYEHLYSFKRYTHHHCFYLNLTAQSPPAFLRKLHFDLVIFHFTFLDLRGNPALFNRLLPKIDWLKENSSAKIAFVQHDWTSPDYLNQFIKEYKLDHVFSTSPPSEWPKIYSAENLNRAKFSRVLTGYLDEKSVNKIQPLADSKVHRPIDIGYRTRPWRATAWLGRHNYLKAAIAELFEKKGKEAGLTTDISVEYEDFIRGHAWYKFLLGCKYTIGIEGGASLLAPDESVKKRTEEFLAIHPDATFGEVEKACFPNMDGNLSLFALSPRHLEACATKTCQILLEGEYNGVLEAGRHYIPLKRNFANLDEIIRAIKKDSLRESIVNQAYHDIVESGRYTYKAFSQFVLQQSLERESPPTPLAQTTWKPLVYCAMTCLDALSWFKVFIYSSFLRPLKLKFKGWRQPK